MALSSKVGSGNGLNRQYIPDETLLATLRSGFGNSVDQITNYHYPKTGTTSNFVQRNFVHIDEMKILITIFCFLIITTFGYSQNLIKRIDSLVNLIESTKDLTLKSLCDTTSVSHSDYWVALCEEFYCNKNEIFKIIKWTDKYPFSVV